jgi:hypothetical protein
MIPSTVGGMLRTDCLGGCAREAVGLRKRTETNKTARTIRKVFISSFQYDILKQL